MGVGGFWLFILGPRMNMCERHLSLICSLQPLQPIYKSKSEGQRCCCMSQSSAYSTSLPLNNQPCPPTPLYLDSCLFSFLIQGPPATGLLHTQLPLPTPQNPNGLLLHSFQVSIQHPLHKEDFQGLCLQDLRVLQFSNLVLNPLFLPSACLSLVVGHGCLSLVALVFLMWGGFSCSKAQAPWPLG